MTLPSIPLGPKGERVRTAFARLGLDPSNSDHWFTLLDSYIEGSRGPGAPLKWSATRLNQLITDVGEMESRLLQHAFGKVRRNEIFKQLAKPSGPVKRLFEEKARAYRGLKWQTLKKNYYRGWDPEQNSILARVLDQLAEDYQTEDGKGNQRERLLAWMKTGVTDHFEDEAGNLHMKPRGIRLVAK